MTSPRPLPPRPRAPQSDPPGRRVDSGRESTGRPCTDPARPPILHPPGTAVVSPRERDLRRATGRPRAPPPPAIGALLRRNASVLEWTRPSWFWYWGRGSRRRRGRRTRYRAEIEQALAAEVGSPMRVVFKQNQGDSAAPMIRAEVSDEAEALSADKRKREQEARQHPIIQKAQDLFGVAIREIKT